MTTQQDQIEADFIVIGAGSAGLRGGGAAQRGPGDPGRAARGRRRGQEPLDPHPARLWQDLRRPERQLVLRDRARPGAGDRRVFWPRGKVLGGSSSINGMVYIRGQAEDFDHWRQLGNTGWSYDDVLPYFRRAEHQTRGADEFHGTGGPLCVSDVPDHHPICEAFIDAAMALGFPRNDDFNGATPGRRRLAPDDDAQRPALLDRGRLSAAGDAAAEPARHHRGADRKDPVRGQPGRRRRVPPRRRDPARARGAARSSCAAARSTRRNC